MDRSLPTPFSAARVDDLHVLAVHGHQGDEDSHALLAAILDGADDHARVHGHERAAVKECIHRGICQSCLKAGEGEWCIELGNRFSEGAFAAFYGPHAVRLAASAALSIHKQLEIWNLEHHLSWEEQIHSRVAITSKPWSGILELMPHAMRGDVVVNPDLWEELLDFETVLSSVSVRCPQLGEQWGEVARELEEGIELPGTDLHVGRHFALYQKKFAANRAALAAASAAVG
ncbi:MAG: hypothetical protein ACR2FY_04740 [Pirellulaceae bacterium]